MMGDSSGGETAFMRRALELGARGEGRVSPNPPVGCVLVKNGRVIAEGWHDRYGGPHAEAMALASLPPGGAAGATAYVTLSPCATRGKQPPCADALAAAGVEEVVAASLDPNPKNSSGLARLGELGVRVRRGLLEAEAEYLARGFFSRFRAGRPFVTLKYAMTLDGRIAAAGGDSRWVSSPESRLAAHDLRSRSDAVMVGIGTALADDPLLTVRDPVLSRRSDTGPHPQPLRVVVDSHCRLAPEAAMLSKTGSAGGAVIVACLAGAAAPGRADLVRAGAEALTLPERAGRVGLRRLAEELGNRGVNQILCEGGSGLAAGLVAENLLDEAVVFVAPKVIGGSAAPGPVGGPGILLMREAIPLEFREIRRVGDDLMLRAVPPGR